MPFVHVFSGTENIKFIEPKIFKRRKNHIRFYFFAEVKINMFVKRSYFK